MKKINVDDLFKLIRSVLLFILLYRSIHRSSGADQPQNRGLGWEYTNTVSSDISFRIYSTTNLSLLLTSWSLFTNVYLTNLTMKTVGTTNSFSFFFQQIPQQQYFTVRTYSAFYNLESDFSNVTNTPAPPISSQNLSIH